MTDITPEELLDELESIDPPDVTSDHLHRWWTGLERARARITELEAENDETDKAHADEIAAHQETLLRIAELEQHVAALLEKNRKMEVIVRERTHRTKGCLCERCLEQEFYEAEVIAAMRADAERYRWVRDWFAVEDVERLEEIRGHVPHESESLRFDAAVDAARANQSP